MGTKLSLDTTIVLDNGVEIPQLGLGTWQSKPGKEAYQAVLYGLEIGYRHIDTAAIYGNEQDVGKAIRDSGIDTNEIFVTTKVWNTDQGYDSTLKAFDKSLEKLGLDNIDLYLIHWPLEGIRKETWRALLTIYQQRGARSIGISNYSIKHIAEFIDETEIIPVVNQVELTPYLYQKDLIEYCHSHRIRIEAYSPLIRGRKFNDERLIQLAAKYNKTMAQILIRWSLQRDLICLPKSVNPQRIKENMEVYDFEISLEDMLLLDSFDENYRVAWDPTLIP
jgi:diketogulonate reductase-like aldo/keto reductase